MAVYYRWVGGVETDPVYAVLRKVLMQMPAEYPYRGPEEYREEAICTQIDWLEMSGSFPAKKRSRGKTPWYTRQIILAAG